MHARSLIVVMALMALWGCRSDPVRQPPVSRGQQASVQELARDIQNARDPLAEAEALRRLHAHAAERNYTYTVVSYNAETNQRVRGATGLRFPLRTEVTVYRAAQPIHTFSFTPRDNRNLAQIAADE